MDISLQFSVFFGVLLLANAITGGCFPSSEEKLNSTVSWLSGIHPQFFTPSEKLASNQNSVFTYGSGYTWVPGDGHDYVGLETILDVYGFSLQPGQLSSAVIQITNRGDGSSLSGVQIGWRIDPSLYKDSHTHFYATWTNGGKCQDIICPGFQKTSSKIAPGDVISPISIIHGRKAYIKLRIFKERSSGDWHVHYGVNGDAKPIGYFPKLLVSGLIDKPVDIIFCGFVKHVKPQQSPPMGSGDVPASGYAASFNGLKLIDADGNRHVVNTNMRYFVAPRNCYPITSLNYAQFFYGGQVVLTNYVIFDICTQSANNQ